MLPIRINAGEQVLQGRVALFGDYFKPCQNPSSTLTLVLRPAIRFGRLGATLVLPRTRLRALANNYG